MGMLRLTYRLGAVWPAFLLLAVVSFAMGLINARVFIPSRLSRFEFRARRIDIKLSKIRRVGCIDAGKSSARRALRLERFGL